MRGKFVLLLILFSTIAYSQKEELTQKVNTLKEQIAQSEKGQKLEALEQLTYLVEFNEDYKYTELATETVNLAVELDSLELATRLTGDQIYYRCNILNKPKEGLALYEDFKGKEMSLTRYRYRSNLHLYTGDCYSSLGQFDKAIEQFEISKEFAQRSNSKIRVAQALYRIGFTKGSKGEFAAASQDLRAANTIYTELKDTLNRINVKNGLSILYSQNGFFEEAQKEREEAIALNTKNDGSVYGVYYNASADAREQGDLDGWISNLEKSLEESKKTPYKNVIQPNIFNTLVIAHATAGNLQKARKYLKIVESDPEKYTTGNAAQYYLEAQKQFAFAEKKYTKAIELGKQHLALKKEEQSFVEIYNAENFLAKVYAKQGNKAASNVHKNEYYQIKDSISSAQNVRSLAYFQTLYETEKRDLKIAAQSSELELLETRNRVRMQWFIIAGVIGLLSLLVLFLRNKYEQKYQKRLAVEQLRAKISADLHDDVGSLLTGLSMQSEILALKAPDDIKPKLQRISELSRESMLKMRDAVWAMDSRKDNWQSLIDRINEFASETFGAKEIQYTLEEKNLTNQESLSGPIRQHLYLVAKEAVANIIKHSDASSAVIQLEKSRTTIAMNIKDNGTVIQKQAAAGLGLSNMKDRIKQLEGDLSIDATQGYQISIRVPA